MSDWIGQFRLSMKPADLRGAAFVGLILGLGTFWNGALIIAALLMLGSAIVWSPRRVELLVVCAIATFLAIVEARGFITSGKEVAPHFQFGFVAETPTVRGIVIYFLQVFGVLIPLLAAAMFLLRPRGRWLLASVLVPLAFASLFAFTPDVAVNHKFVNAGVRVASIFAAMLVVWLLEEGRIGKILAVSLIFLLTVTGAVDMISLWNFNNEKRTHDLADPLLEWAHQDTPPGSIFASAPIYHNRAYLTGRKSYLGLPYWAESAGYDVPSRLANLKKIYESGNPDSIRQVVAREKISYVIVDDSVRKSFPRTDEGAIASSLGLAFSSGSTRVYSPSATGPGAKAVPNPAR
jgi:hypothetical protein